MVSVAADRTQPKASDVPGVSVQMTLQFVRRRIQPCYTIDGGPTDPSNAWLGDAGPTEGRTHAAHH
jgi:hypothetical protein